MSEYRFVVPGKPVAKQRPRTVYRRGRRPVTYTPQDTVNYERLVGWHAKQAGVRPIDGPVEVEATFYVSGRVDGDNLVKSLLDAMTGIAYEDDAQVVAMHIRKHKAPLAEQRAEVVVREARDGEAHRQAR